MNARVFIQTMIALASVSLGLVAALAWNEAIKATLAKLGLGNDLAGLYTYAVLATVIAVTVLVWLGRIAARVGADAAIDG
jgi:Family of unknown function (DUF5654)